MLKQLTMEQAHEAALELMEMAQKEPVVITKNGTPLLVTLSVERLLSLLETADILADAELMEQLEESIQQANRGELYDISVVRESLSL